MFYIPFIVQIKGTDTTLNGSSLSTINPTTITGSDLSIIIAKGIAYLIVMAGFLSIAYVIYGGIQLITSGGKEENKSKAFQTIKYAILGLLITILAFTIINFIGQLLHLELVNYVSFEQIVDIINNLFKTIS